ncbi:MAG: DUF2231 domain-containing protein [Kofleriaceae bacterium]|nr:DUF2231 domain-containing protein [Kofleriaceae bacterium]
MSPTVEAVMSAQSHYSKASIKGHPIHPMLVSFPIALYTSGVASTVVFAVSADTFWYRAAMTLFLAGAAMATLAAIPGVIDLFAGIPRRALATRNTGIIHMGLNVLSLALFSGAGFSMLSAWTHTTGTEAWLPYKLPLTLSVIGLVLTMGAGFFGWKLVQTHHVGITEPPESTEYEKSMAGATSLP